MRCVFNFVSATCRELFELMKFSVLTSLAVRRRYSPLAPRVMFPTVTGDLDCAPLSEKAAYLFDAWGWRGTVQTFFVVLPSARCVPLGVPCARGGHRQIQQFWPRIARTEGVCLDTTVQAATCGRSMDHSSTPDDCGRYCDLVEGGCWSYLIAPPFLCS